MPINQYFKLLYGMIRGDIAKTGPFYVNIDLSKHCNMNCLDCQYHSPFSNRTSTDDDGLRDIPVKLIERLCKDLKMLGTRTIALTGEGEPMLHPQFTDIISMVKQQNFNITLNTNGTLINEKIIEALIKEKLNITKIGIWAGSKNGYRKNFPESNPDNFEKIIYGLNCLSSMKKNKIKRIQKLF